MTRRAVGIDIGGSAIKLGVVDEKGGLLRRAALPTANFLSVNSLADGLTSAVRDLDGIELPLALATPGYLDPETGIRRDGMGNVPAMQHGSLPQELVARGVRCVATVNDGVAAAFGEARFGAGRDCARFVMVTMGTGIGGAVVIDGRVITGDAGVPPELGAMALDADGRTLEQTASASGFIKTYGDHGGAACRTPADVLGRAAEGEAAALAALDDVCRGMAQALGSMVNLLNLQRCLLGGGIAEGAAPLLRGIRTHMPRYTWPFLLRHVQVLPAARGTDAGLLGAAAKALDWAPKATNR